MREMLRRRWVLGTAVVVLVLAVVVTASLIIRARSTEPWPTTSEKHDACAVIRHEDFGVFSSVRPLTDLFDDNGGGPELVQRSVEPMATSGELGESCVYSSRFGNGNPRFRIKLGPTMDELPKLKGMKRLIAGSGGFESTAYRPIDGSGPDIIAARGKFGIVEVSAIGFPKGLKNEGPGWSSGVNDLAWSRSIAITDALVERLGWTALPLTTAEGVCRQPDDADLETALGKKPTFSRSVNHDDYDHCAYTSNNGTKLTVRIERGRPSSSRPPGDGWDEVEETPNTYRHDNQVAVVNPKQRSVAYLEVTSPNDETQERNPQDLADLGKQLLTATKDS